MPDFPTLEDFEGHGRSASLSLSRSSSKIRMDLPDMMHAPEARATFRTRRGDILHLSAISSGVYGRWSSLLTLPLPPGVGGRHGRASLCLQRHLGRSFR